MILTDTNLRTLFTGYMGAFKNGWARPKPFYDRVAMITNSGTSEEKYTWLGQFPRIREWIGDRVVNNLSGRGYTIVNRLFEQTIAVPRTKIEDDRYGIYAPMFDEMGRDAAEFPNQLVSELMLGGFTALCYDGQNFFDTDHPVLDDVGAEYSVSNCQPGTDPAWYLIDDTRAMGALIYQKRLDFEFQTLDDGMQSRGASGLSDRTFFKDEYVYGVRGRSSAGYGFWQLAFGSKLPLNAANYAAARSAMQTLKGDFGRKLGIVPTVLLCGPELESAARKLLNNELGASGETNEWKGTAELIISPWLSA